MTITQRTGRVCVALWDWRRGLQLLLRLLLCDLQLLQLLQQLLLLLHLLQLRQQTQRVRVHTGQLIINQLGIPFNTSDQGQTEMRGVWSPGSSAELSQTPAAPSAPRWLSVSGRHQCITDTWTNQGREPCAPGSLQSQRLSSEAD